MRMTAKSAERIEYFKGHEDAAACIFYDGDAWGLRSYFTDIIIIKNNILTVHNNTKKKHSPTTSRHIGWFTEKFGKRYDISSAIIKELYKNGEALNLKTRKRVKVKV